MNPLHRLLRYARASYELVRGHLTFGDIHPAVTVFGSARFPLEHPYCVLAEALGHALARAGYTVVSGAGPSVMEAVSRGAKRAGGRTIGANIVIPHEQRSNPHVDSHVTFTTFWARKAMLMNYASAFVVMPGGFGTLDELTEVVNLIQARMMKPAPVILVGSAFWAKFVDFCRDPLLKEGAISASFFDLIRIVDTPEEAVEAIPQGERRR